jgi:hypothetical protein
MSSSNIVAPVETTSSNVSSTVEESALMNTSESLLDLPEASDARVFVRCNYCTNFRSGVDANKNFSLWLTLRENKLECFTLGCILSLRSDGRLYQSCNKMFPINIRLGFKFLIATLVLSFSPILQISGF